MNQINKRKTNSTRGVLEQGWTVQLLLDSFVCIIVRDKAFRGTK